MLATKFFAPRWRRQQVSRPRLAARIDGDAKLVLLCAPPGFGKTTLLAEWLSGKEEPVAWLSLDSTHDDPRTFWAYLVRAMQTARPGLGEAVAAFLDAQTLPPIETLISMLLNEVVALKDELLVVLDDYHVIENAAIHDGMAFLIEQAPETLRVVIASRADPPLHLPRLRARGELIEIRATDLRFSTEEAGAFFGSTMGVRLTPEQLSALEARTEGWIAALQLAALSMQGRDDTAAFIASFTGNDRYIVDYLVDEVLQRQGGTVREFLLRTSVLDRFNAPLCDAVTGEDP
jgi:LuxR family maltose regulon positive regulatory protein